MSGCVSVSQAARLKCVTRQAVYLAIKCGRLKAYRTGERWKIFKTDLDAYEDQKWTRKASRNHGELIFDDRKGIISMEDASKMIGVPRQKLYYAARIGLLVATRVKCSWVLKVEDLLRYEERYLKKVSRKVSRI